MVHGKQEFGAVAFTMFQESTSYVLDVYLMCPGIVSHDDVSSDQQNQNNRHTNTSTANFYHIDKS